MSRRPKDWRGGFQQRVGCRTRIQEPLSEHTTFGVGGAAELMVWLDSEESLLVTQRYLAAEGVGWRVLGKGSNLLVSDAGTEGAVLKLSGRLAAIQHLERGYRSVVVEVGGGLTLSKLIRVAQGCGAGGLEGLAGIPGTVGGAVKLNAGTRAGTVGDRLIEVRLFRGGRLCWVPVGALELGYRSSNIGLRSVVVAARFRLPRRDPRKIQEQIQRVQRWRAATQPRGVRSAGCFFRNPPEGPAGRLIEEAGCKRTRLGGAFVSGVHANFIVHRGDANASDILGLSHQVARAVRKAFGVCLQREVELWGRFGPGDRRRRSR